MEQISIVIPIYNSERYLCKCLESVIEQTYSHIEIILVDDGSIDGSYQICLEYAQKDNRIKVLHIDNGGVSRARKVGMSSASGNVIAFVDSDDWLEPETIEIMYMEMEKRGVDIVAAGYIETYKWEEKVVPNKLQAGIYKGKDLERYVYPKMLCCSDFFEMGVQPYLWNKLYRRAVIEPHVMALNEAVVVGEDVLCLYPALLDANSISVLAQGYYHYCMHEGSTMRKFRSVENEMENIRIQYTELDRIFSSSTYKNILLPQLNRYILHHFMVREVGGLILALEENAQPVLQKMEPGKKVVIYGAGAFGISLYRFFAKEKNYCLVGWCDRDYMNIRRRGYPVEKPSEVLQQEFDYIVIGVLNQKVAELIKKLLNDKGVEYEKMIWLHEEMLKNEALAAEVVNRKIREN